MKPNERTYTRPEISVTYQPRRCLHVAECLRRAPNVFNTWEQPWVQIENGSVEEIVAAIEHCPTGALHYERADGGAQERPRAKNVVRVSRDGPYYVAGDLEIVMPDGSVLRETRAAFCRCGASNNKPFCDNSHRAISFRDDGLREPETNAADELAPQQTLKITPRPNGSLRLDGAFELRDAFGQVIARRTEARLCRCGASADKPFCDSAHKQIGFQTETAASSTADKP